MKKLILILVVAILTISLVACGGSPASETKANQSATDGEQPVSEGPKELTLLYSEIKTLDNALASDSSSSFIVGLMVETVTEPEGSNGQTVIRNGIAKSYEANDDMTEYTFHLQDTKWSDAVELTAQHVKDGYVRTFDPATGSDMGWMIPTYVPITNAEAFNTGVEGITADDLGIEVIDDKTIKFTFEKPAPLFPQVASFSYFAPIRLDIIEKHGKSYGSEANTVVSSGPYVVTEWAHDQHIILEKNPGYFDSQKYPIDKITFNIVPDTETRMKAFQAGEADIVDLSTAEWRDLFEQTDGVTVTSYANLETLFHHINHKDSLLSNTKIRQALTAALDREQYVNDIRDGFNIPAATYMNPNIALGNELYSEGVKRVTGNESNFLTRLQNEIDPRETFIEGLKELGLDPNPENHTIRWMFRGEDQTTRERGEWYQQLYKDVIGVNIELEFYHYTIAYEKAAKGEHQLFDAGWNVAINDPIEYFSFWHGESGYYNSEKTGWSNQEFNDLLDKSYETFDTDELLKIYYRMEEIMAYEDVVVIPTEFTKSYVAYKNELKNVNFPLYDYRGLTK